MAFLAGSTILHRGDRWTVLGIRPEGVLIERTTYGRAVQHKTVPLPVAWRGYDAMRRQQGT